MVNIYYVYIYIIYLYIIYIYMYIIYVYYHMYIIYVCMYIYIFTPNYTYILVNEMVDHHWIICGNPNAINLPF